MTEFKFPPSVQSDLFAKLTPRQQIETANVFRHIKKGSQVQLAYVLLDYIEDAVIPDFQDDEMVLAASFVSLTCHGMEEKAPWAIRPFQNDKDAQKHENHQPRKIGDIIKEFFPSLPTSFHTTH